MTLFEVVLKITHDCPFANLSRKYPSLEMCSWCNGEHDVYELHTENKEEYDALFSDLTEKQMDALLIAHNNGYYLFPRNDIQQIAAKRKVPRTTFQEHLKKPRTTSCLRLYRTFSYTDTHLWRSEKASK